jgi:hypothetical protein
MWVLLIARFLSEQAQGSFRTSFRLPGIRLPGNHQIALVLASMTGAACGEIVVTSRKPEVMTMTTSQHAPCQPSIWRSVRAVASALRTLHREQTIMWELWWQANRATVPSEGPLIWVLALDGHRLAGRYVTVPPAATGDTP